MGSLMAPPGGANFEKAPEGEHVARCQRVVQLGTHYNEKFGKRAPKVLISWELPMVRHKSGDYRGQPFVVSKQYTLSSHEKSALRADLEWWYGKKFNSEELERAGGFDLAKIVGREAVVTLEHNDKYVNVIAISRPEAGQVVPPAVLEPSLFSFAEATYSDWSRLTEGIQKWIRDCDEWPALESQLGLSGAPDYGELPADDDDDIPFMFPLGFGLLGLGAWAYEAVVSLSQMVA